MNQAMVQNLDQGSIIIDLDQGQNQNLNLEKKIKSKVNSLKRIKIAIIILNSKNLLIDIQSNNKFQKFKS